MAVIDTGRFVVRLLIVHACAHEDRVDALGRVVVLGVGGDQLHRVGIVPRVAVGHLRRVADGVARGGLRGELLQLGYCSRAQVTIVDIRAEDIGVRIVLKGRRAWVRYAQQKRSLTPTA